MVKLKEAIHKALRDDSEATVGIRALLGHPLTPFGVYYHMLPEKPDFSTLTWLTWYFLGGGSVNDVHGVAFRKRERAFAVTVWSEDPDKVCNVHQRVRNILDGLHKVTRPTSEVDLHQMLLEDEGTDLFDDDFKTYYRTEGYRAWYRDDITN